MMTTDHYTALAIAFAREQQARALVAKTDACSVARLSAVQAHAQACDELIEAKRAARAELGSATARDIIKSAKVHTK